MTTHCLQGNDVDHDVLGSDPVLIHKLLHSPLAYEIAHLLDGAMAVSVPHSRRMLYPTEE